MRENLSDKPGVASMDTSHGYDIYVLNICKSKQQSITKLITVTVMKIFFYENANEIQGFGGILWRGKVSNMTKMLIWKKISISNL